MSRTWHLRFPPAGLIPVAFLAAVWPGSAATADFDQSIAPLLKTQCAECHSDKVKTSGFSVSSRDSIVAGGNKYGRAVVEGHPEKSPLIRLLTGELTPAMPLGKSLAKSDISRIEDWIRNLRPEDSAVEIGEWRWPFEKPTRHEPPTVRDQASARNLIDAFILSRLEKEGLQPAPPASKLVLARRVYMNLIGMPPSPEDLETFLANESPNAYEDLIDKLLDDPRYGERWGRHWLDLVRYGETSGLEGDGAIGNAWRYRDWVIDAFNADMPYDRFVIQQLAGADEHSKTRNNYRPDIQGHIPLGFLRVAPWDRSNLVAGEVRQNYLSEVASATGSISLGLTLGCARCHDHKYDPIPTKDYYRFQAFFNTIQAERGGIQVPYRNKEFTAKAEKKVADYQERLKNGPEKKELDELEADLLKKLIARKKELAKDKKLANTDLRLEIRRKEQTIFTREEQERHADLLEDADRTRDPEEKDALEAYEAVLMEKLTAAYAKPGASPEDRFEALTAADVRAEVAKRYSSENAFTEAERERHNELSSKLEVFRRRMGRWQPTALTVGNVPGPPNGPMIAPTRILNRGDYRQPGEIVEPGFPSAITGNFEPAVLETDRYRQFPTRGWRMTLAKWIASPDNPLTARVIVNRLWQQHFGRGIVGTPSDFGKNGERPTHPELLDWMAVKFVEDGWSIKAMHRLMLTSNTYRQASENPAADASTKDPGNRLLWKFNRRRLEAEAIRDSILYLSGRLNPERGGPSVFPPLPDDLADFARYGRTGGLMWEPNEKEEDARRRSIYIFQRRSLPLPMMAAFDATAFSESCERRSVTTTPLQALSMMNGYLVHEESEYMAKRVQEQAGPDRKAQIARAFQLLLNRPAGSEEMERFASFQGDLASLCRVLVNSNEFLYVD